MSTSSKLSRRRAIRTDRDGFSAVLDALDRRQCDLYTISATEWRRMSGHQRTALIDEQNRQLQHDHRLGDRYVESPQLKAAMAEARRLYLGMSPAQRHRVLHPRRVDEWLVERRVLTIVARDLEALEEPPDYILPEADRLPDEGPQPQRPESIYLTVALNLDAPVDRIVDAVKSLVMGLHPPASRRPRRSTSSRPERQKYNDDDVARMIRWYYRRGAGISLKTLATEASGPRARHVAATQRTIDRQLRWFRQAIGIA